MTELKENYDKYLMLNYTSIKTIESYKNCFNKFTKDNSRVYRMSNSDLKDYFIYFTNTYSISYYNQMISSVKIIFKLLRQPLKIKGIYYKKDSVKQIDILCKEELKNGVESISNLKHRCLVNLLYIGALRISELQNIKVLDIDSKNNRILIHNSKGSKSRHVPISSLELVKLREYFKEYRPKVYLFEGETEGKKYSQTSIRKVVNKIKTSKRVYPHLLRHTALTNLVDNGHNILKIQRFAGHSNPKSTQRYYHLSQKALEGMSLTLTN